MRISPIGTRESSRTDHTGPMQPIAASETIAAAGSPAIIPNASTLGINATSRFPPDSSVAKRLGKSSRKLPRKPDPPLANPARQPRDQRFGVEVGNGAESQIVAGEHGVHGSDAGLAEAAGALVGEIAAARRHDATKLAR